jgi:putative hydrolase of the HAD superfamily
MVPTMDIRAVFWDFGGVILSSPFDAFNEYERAHGLPADFIRSVNAVDPHTNAWARIERQELTPAEFDLAFAEESEHMGHRVPGRDVLGLLGGAVRPEMVTALDRVIEAGFVTACLTNNVAGDPRPDIAGVMSRFHHVVESSKVGGRHDGDGTGTGDSRRGPDAHVTEPVGRRRRARRRRHRARHRSDRATGRPPRRDRGPRRRR